MKRKRKLLYQHLIFIVTGASALVWYITRIIQKPSRASYPCMRATAPIASSFVLYLIGLATTVFVFKKSKHHFFQLKYNLAILFLIFGTVAGLFTLTLSDQTVFARYEDILQVANDPVGIAKGINPGRVVWVYNPDATNENCTNVWNDGWFMDKNNDQNTIDQMVSESIQRLTDETNDADSWDAIFQYYNQNHGKGSVNYANGEKILVKINCTSSWAENINPSDLSIVNNSNYGISETSPHVVLSVLRQLVDIVGVNQSDIYVGDPIKHIYKHCYDLWYAEFPNVNYMDNSYGSEKGRVVAIASTNPLIFYSDEGSILRTGSWNDASSGDPVTEDHLYTIFEDAEYIINIPALKAHARAGITLFAKNHFGSHTRSDALHLHNGLVNPDGINSGNSRFGTGLYRVQVDMMGHELLGGKTLIYLLDGLWAGSEATDPPRKWSIEPFNNDWTSSIFVSQDPVAIESVAFDFLRSEYTATNPYCSYPQMEGVDDYLHQAADNTNWPVGITYDPENDGSALQSLGAHEHWNNEIDKQYTRNLGTGNGIELIASMSGYSGDVDGDDAVNSTDALIILSCDVGIDVSAFCPMNCGDVNNDGLTNSTDALIILSYDVGLTVPFPVGETGCSSNVTPCAGCSP